MADTTTSEKPLAGKTALVTGASRGIGYEAALGLAKAGAHVIALARNVGGLEDLDDAIQAVGGSATLVPLDLKDHDGINRLADSIAERWGQLDILLGNAGLLGSMTPLAHLPPATFDDVMAVNVTANFQLLRALDPLLRASANGRALFLTSGAVRSLRPYASCYSASKAALEALIKTYAKETEHTSLRVNLLDPGTLRTRMRAQYAPGEDPETVTHPKEIVPTIVKLLDEETTESGEVYSFKTKTWL